MSDRAFGCDVVLVTGANGGPGTRFVRRLLDRGAAEIDAAAASAISS